MDLADTSLQLQLSYKYGHLHYSFAALATLKIEISAQYSINRAALHVQYLNHAVEPSPLAQGAIEVSILAP